MGYTFPEEVRLRALDLYNGGLSGRKVAQVIGMGVTGATVSFWIRKAGIARTLREARALNIESTNATPMIGHQFGWLTVRARYGTKEGKATWLCECRCGMTTTACGHCLRNGNTASCGCMLVEARKENGRRNDTSGHLDRIRNLPQTKRAQRRTGKRLGKWSVDSGHLNKIRGLAHTPEANLRRKIAMAPQWDYVHSLPQSKAAYSRTGRKNVARINNDPMLTKKRKKLAGQALARKPSWPEVRFYGLVLGDPTTANGFTAQQYDGSGVYDGAWPGMVAELDGGAHHAFEDRHAEDAQKDATRRSNGKTVLRETDENVLYLKALAVLSDR